MKKYIVSLFLACAFVASSFGASTSLTITNGIMTNLNIPSGSLKVAQVVLTSAGTNSSTNFYFIDTYTNWTVFTNSAYTNILSYGTNLVTTWTNYYGATNSVTNIMLVDITNSVAATTNSFPVRIQGSIGTNSSLRYDNVNYYFNNGLWISNSGPAPITATITYTQ